MCELISTFRNTFKSLFISTTRIRITTGSTTGIPSTLAQAFESEYTENGAL